MKKRLFSLTVAVLIILALSLTVSAGGMGPYDVTTPDQIDYIENWVAFVDSTGATINDAETGEPIERIPANQEVICHGAPENGEYFVTVYYETPSEIYGTISVEDIDVVYDAVTMSRLNVRDIPDTSGEIKGILEKEHMITVLGGLENGWYWVIGYDYTTNQLVEGYSSGDYVSLYSLVAADYYGPTVTPDESEDENDVSESVSKPVSEPIPPHAITPEPGNIADNKNTSMPVVLLLIIAVVCIMFVGGIVVLIVMLTRKSNSRSQTETVTVSKPKTLYCTNCGAAVSVESAFCSSCGTKVEIPTEYFDETETGSDSYQNVETEVNPPINQMPLNCGMFKFRLLGWITFGIYPIVVMTKITNQLNEIASPHDNKKTMHYCLLYFLLSWVTLGIMNLIWYTKISSRIKDEMRRRNINYSFGAGSFWLWNILGSLIFVGPFIYDHKFLKAMNLIKKHYNLYG